MQCLWLCFDAVNRLCFSQHSNWWKKMRFWKIPNFESMQYLCNVYSHNKDLVLLHASISSLLRFDVINFSSIWWQSQMFRRLHSLVMQNHSTKSPIQCSAQHLNLLGQHLSQTRAYQLSWEECTGLSSAYNPKWQIISSQLLTDSVKPYA